jgi:hypothetical protein
VRGCGRIHDSIGCAAECIIVTSNAPHLKCHSGKCQDAFWNISRLGIVSMILVNENEGNTWHGRHIRFVLRAESRPKDTPQSPFNRSQTERNRNWGRGMEGPCMLYLSQAGVPAWSVIEARGTVEPPQFSSCISYPNSRDPFNDNFLQLDDFLGDVLAGGDLRIQQSCMWDEDETDVRSEEPDLHGQQSGRQSDEYESGERCRAVERFPRAWRQHHGELRMIEAGRWLWKGPLARTVLKAYATLTLRTYDEAKKVTCFYDTTPSISDHLSTASWPYSGLVAS